MHRFFTSAALVLSATALAFAQPAQDQNRALIGQNKPAAEDAVVTTIQTYNVSDLVRVATDYRAPELVASPFSGALFGGGGAGGDPGMVGGRAATTNAVTPNSIAQLIQTLVEPESWTVNGGGQGEIREMGNLLIVRQAPAVHARVAELVRQLRETASPSRVLKITADWIQLERERDPAEVANDGAVLHQLLQKPYARAQTTCFNGQTVYITSGREQTYVKDAQPIVGNNAVGLDLRPDMARSGVMLQVSPQLVPESDTVVLDLTSIVREIQSIEAAVPATQPSLNFTQGSIDRVRQLSQQLQTTLRTKLGKRTIVGGMTLDPTGENPKQLLLVVLVEVAE